MLIWLTDTLMRKKKNANKKRNKKPLIYRKDGPNSSPD